MNAYFNHSKRKDSISSPLSISNQRNKKNTMVFTLFSYIKIRIEAKCIHSRPIPLTSKNIFFPEIFTSKLIMKFKIIILRKKNAERKNNRTTDLIPLDNQTY